MFIKHVVTIDDYFCKYSLNCCRWEISGNLTLTRNLSISAVWLNVCHRSLLVCRELAMLVLQSCMYLPLPKLKSVKPAA